MQTTSWYTSKWAIICYHVFAWVVTLFLPHLMRTVLESEEDRPRNERMIHPDKLPHYHNDSAVRFPGPPPRRADRTEPKFFTQAAMAMNLSWIGIFYLNAFALIPALVYRRKVLQYILVQVLLFVSVALLVSLYFYWRMKGIAFRFPMPLLFNIFPFFFVQAGSIAYRFIADKIEADRQKKETENESLRTELSFLRSQISPHFIFNVLNNMVSLARKKSDLLEPSLIRLSGLMRYMLYESDETRVSLGKEMEYLQHYIDLQMLRFGNDVQLDADLREPDAEYSIEPMLLIPFVENAFKHSTGSMYKPQIAIKLRTEKGLLHLHVSNSFLSAAGNNADLETSGIGLTNVRRRLNLLYAHKHELLITESDNVYLVTLQIRLV
ncbi:sensor histidine kinase [Flavihumibacter solisilvae]|uniref:Signal transduction histidine kinase internal region domain-containing protein n=1 Tax=Flavihumibacter solisilvae TaxID=1349421 RepID=A0A0C1KZA8_9BACT|nr:sensor histidine kinase [Flavihumibacter solisilvae]KIC93012.1 hypothetical protein OI18_19875 [Flavihumibacter solisilvae]